MSVGVYLPHMDMPTRCAECWLMDGEDSWCTACRGRHLYPEYRYGTKDRPDWCPLVPIPPHGDLIDRDALREEVKKYATPSDAWVFSLIRAALTIISAEPAEGE